MKTSTWSDYELSRLMLGTVQFGMPYGVANRTGQPAYRDVLAIVAAAVEGGVNCFDTAAAYGTSEEVLGRTLGELGVADRVVVVTKVRPLTPDEVADSTAAARAIEQSVMESRRRLRINCLPVILFHRESDAAFLGELEELKKQGWLRHAGVSCDNLPGPAAGFAADARVSALQIPGSVLDRRHQRSGVFQDAAARGVAVFLRSVYLQGLLVMSESDIPPALADIVPMRRRLAALAHECGMQLAELALRYLLSQRHVTCVLTGVETVEQVRDNLALFERGPLDAGTLAAIDALALAPPEHLITPRLWPPRATQEAASQLTSGSKTTAREGVADETSSVTRIRSSASSPTMARMLIPSSQVSSSALRAIVEEFVTRDGTDHSLVARRIERVMRQLEAGQLELHFDDESGTCDIRPAGKGTGVGADDGGE